MRTIYELDEYKVATGSSKQVSDSEPRELNWVAANDAPSFQFPRWTGSTWLELNEHPNTPAMKAATAATAAEAGALKAIEDSKLTGIEILGVMCSATKTDQTGMLAVGFNKLLADMAGQPFPPTKFEFENGAELVITAANYATVQAIWVPFRQTFFAA
jgi:hypothetical protein